jgi:hypothetical protein
MTAEVRGKAAVQLIMKDFIDSFRYSGWQEISFVVEGNKAALHWRTNVTFTRNRRTQTFDVFDFLTFRDGKSWISAKAPIPPRFARCSRPEAVREPLLGRVGSRCTRC